MSSNCAFCKVIGREQQADIVYEDSTYIAFLSITPLNKGHVLLMPTPHYPSITAVPDHVREKMMTLGSHLGCALMRATDSDGFNFFLANGQCAGQIILHAHLHIVPRCPGDGLVFPSRSIAYESDEEKEEIIRNTQSRLEI